MIRMIAKQPCTYGTRRMVAGDEFDASGRSDARLYSALGWAEVKPVEEDPPAVVAWAEEWKVPAVKTAAAKKITVKRKYTKRNLTTK